MTPSGCSVFCIYLHTYVTGTTTIRTKIAPVSIFSFAPLHIAVVVGGVWGCSNKIVDFHCDYVTWTPKLFQLVFFSFTPLHIAVFVCVWGGCSNKIVDFHCSIAHATQSISIFQLRLYTLRLSRTRNCFS